jgi:GTP pyrophosphokinase
LANSYSDCDTIVSAILHDTVEDTIISLDNINTIFGGDVKRIVSGVTKVCKLAKTRQEQVPKMEDYMNKKTLKNENIRNMFIAMSDDWRIIQVKVADRLHNLRTLSYLPIQKQKSIARESMDIYAPLAHRLGMYEIKTEMEDISFKYLNPNEYEETVNAIGNKTDNNTSNFLDNIRLDLEESLKIRVDFEISSRTKSIYSTWRKSQKYGGNIDEVLDLHAIRVVFADSEDNTGVAFGILGKVHSIWNHIPLSTKDYITKPKANGYQSLHTTVLINNEPLEVQIRSQSMHRVAEYGAAAHVSYKESLSVPWLKIVKEWDNTINCSEQFIKQIREELLNSHTFVFSPNGNILNLKKGTTLIELVRSGCISKNNKILVNNEPKCNTYVFSNGDILSYAF